MNSTPKRVVRERCMQVLIFIVRCGEGPRAVLNARFTGPKIFALLPPGVDEERELHEAFSKSNVFLLNSDRDCEICKQEDAVEMIELFLSLSDSGIDSRKSEDALPTLVYDLKHTASLKSIFCDCSYFTYKIKENCLASLKVTDTKAFRSILSRNVNISYEDSNVVSLLHFALERELFDIVETLLKNGGDWNVYNHDGSSSLHMAVEKGNVKTVELLLQQNSVNINKQIEVGIFRGYTPLHLAVYRKNVSLVNLLLERGANINIAARYTSVIRSALQTRRDEIVEAILRFRMNQDDPLFRQEVLDDIVKTECRHLNRSLRSGFMQSSADLVDKDLMLGAIMLKNHEFVSELIDRGASLDDPFRGKNGIAPLHLAAELGCDKIVKLLLDRGAEVDVLSMSTGRTPLFYAIGNAPFAAERFIERDGRDDEEEERCNRIIDLLVDNGGDVNAKDRTGLTALHVAAASGKENVVVTLLRRGANVNAKCLRGRTALFYAAEEGWSPSLSLPHMELHDSDLFLICMYYAAGRRSTLISRLVSMGAEVNATAENGRTVLHSVVSMPFFCDLRDLLENGASINVKDGSGKTPLHWACHLSRHLFVEQLIGLGADVDAVCSGGRTPLMYAILGNELDTVLTVLRHDPLINGVNTLDCFSLAHERAIHECSSNVLKQVLEYAFIDPSFLRNSALKDFSKCPFKKWADRTNANTKRINDMYQRHLRMITACFPEIRTVHKCDCQTCVDLDTRSLEFFSDCLKEVERMKNTTVDNTWITLLHIIRKSLNELVVAVGNRYFSDAIKENSYWNDFPIFAGIISAKLQQVHRRSFLLHYWKQIFYVLFPTIYDVPDELMDKIASYLRTNDLKRLVDVYCSVFGKKSTMFSSKPITEAILEKDPTAGEYQIGTKHFTRKSPHRTA